MRYHPGTAHPGRYAVSQEHLSLDCLRTPLADFTDMLSWPDNLSECTTKQLITLRTENQAWHKQLRCAIRALTSRKLSKQIGSEQYAIQRAIVNEHVAECHRRGTALVEEILYRER